MLDIQEFARRAKPEPGEVLAVAAAAGADAATAAAARACFFADSWLLAALCQSASASNWSSMCTVLAPEDPLSAAGEAGVPERMPSCEDGGTPMVKASDDDSDESPRLALEPLA